MRTTCPLFIPLSAFFARSMGKGQVNPRASTSMSAIMVRAQPAAWSLGDISAVRGEETTFGDRLTRYYVRAAIKLTLIRHADVFVIRRRTLIKVTMNEHISIKPVQFRAVVANSLIRALLSWTLLVQGMAYARADSINLPELGDSSMSIISPAQERNLGEEFMRRARQSRAFVDDPELNEYVQALGQRLVAQAETPYRDFRFFMVNDNDINAFAVPGGYIGINNGLLLATRNEAELASVLAHEVTHITQRHIPRMMAESRRTTLPAMAALLAAILLGGSKNASAGVVVTTAAMAQQQLNFTRAYEQEADRIGMALLARASFDPKGMPSFFERMHALNRINETNLPEFLRTHPITSNRIAEARDRAEQLPEQHARDSDDYLHVHAKLRALAPGNDAEIVREFRQNLAQENFRNAPAERYGYAVVLLRQRDYDSARAEAAKLVAHNPDRIYYRILQARIEMEASATARALELYAQAHKRAPTHAALSRYYAETLLQAKQPQRAFQLLSATVRRTKDDPTLYRLLGQAAGAIKNDLEAHKAMAEHYYLNGDPMAAIEQLRLASRHACDNFYQLSSIEARMNAIREEIELFDPPAADTPLGSREFKLRKTECKPVKTPTPPRKNAPGAALGPPSDA
jgi:predicted Zn-dependent protease